MTPKIKHLLPALALALSTVACGSGTTTSSNSGTTTLTGQIDSTPTALTKALVANAVSDTCPVDQIVATSSALTVTSATIDSECQFSLTLARGESYIIGLLANGEFVANMVFEASATNDDQSELPLNGSDDTLDLGTITLTGGFAYPSQNPFESLDSDDDGIFDYDDSDDDDNGYDDDDHYDCDGDGFKYDDDCYVDDNDGMAEILRVKPRSQGGTAYKSEDIQVYLSCYVDPTTLSETPVVVTNDLDESIDCNFELDDSDDDDIGSKLRCDDSEDLLVNGRTYTVQVAGLTCLNGDVLEATEFSFAYSTSFDLDDDSSDDSDDDSNDDDSNDDDSNDDSDDDESNDD